MPGEWVKRPAVGAVARDLQYSVKCPAREHCLPPPHLKSMNRSICIAACPALFPALGLVLTIAACQPGATTPRPARTVAAITPRDVRSRIYLVADDSMLGREAGAIGNFTMTAYLAREVARLGLEPGGDNGTWFQTVPLIRRRADSASTVSVNGKALQLFTDYAPIRPTATIRFAPGLAPSVLETVYGGRAGDSSVTLSTDAVRGRLVVLDAPLGTNDKPTGSYNTQAAFAISRFPGARAIAIAALDLVSAAASSSLRSSGLGLSATTGNTIQLPFGLVISSAAAASMMGAQLGALRPGARGNPVVADVRFNERAVDFPARNVIAILRGSDPSLRGQYVAIGAHSDHVAPASRGVDHDSLRAYNRVMRPFGAESRIAVATTPTPAQLVQIQASVDSLRRLRPARRDSIFNGADDDASGSVAMLEIAESLAKGARPRRSILFVWHTGEESGLLGSAFFTENTTVHRDSIVAQLNMDMVGRGMATDLAGGSARNIQVIGSRRLSTDLGNVVDSVNAASAAPYLIDYGPDTPRHIQNRYCRSDHYMYARTGIPIAYISRGYHQDYHLVTDEAQYISYDGLARVAAFVRDISVALADRNDRVRVDKARPDPLAPCQQ